MAKFETVASIVSDAAVELGLGAVSSPVTSTDPNVVQLLALLKRLGRKLVKHRNWTQLRGQCQLNTTDGVTNDQGEMVFRLPSDFLTMVDQAGWNRSTTQPLAVVGAQRWQAMHADGTVGVLTATFRPAESLVAFYPAPSASQAIVFEYRSRFWVSGETNGRWLSDVSSASEWDFEAGVVLGDIAYRDLAIREHWICLQDGTTDALVALTGTGSNILDGTTRWAYINPDLTAAGTPPLDDDGNILVLTADEPATNSEVLMLEASLLVAGLKLEFLKAKGFDTTAALDDYREALRLAESTDQTAAPVLSVGGDCPPVLGASVPETGFGS